ncbi:glutamate/aspartate transport system permease [Escherichia coli]|uniref:Glutamate/aspartate transport system permease n=1 Tax=Escherichia coli TaxID=562 RepID=A0A377B158_ECOLX|nr:glutamate/aspartate transport system permease [Escherichia coli]
MSIDWNWGIFLQQAPFGNTTYLGWIWSGFQVTIALSILRLDYRFPRRFIFRHFYVPFQTVFSPVWVRCYVELFRNVPLIVQFFTWYLVIPELLPEKIGMWFKGRAGSQYSVFPFIHALPGAVYRRPCLRTGTRRHSVVAAWAKKCRAGDGPDATAGLSIRTAA